MRRLLFLLQLVTLSKVALLTTGVTAERIVTHDLMAAVANYDRDGEATGSDADFLFGSTNSNNNANDAHSSSFGSDSDSKEVRNGDAGSSHSGGSASEAGSLAVNGSDSDDEEDAGFDRQSRPTKDATLSPQQPTSSAASRPSFPVASTIALCTAVARILI